jgi:hypothetical protein
MNQLRPAYILIAALIALLSACGRGKQPPPATPNAPPPSEPYPAATRVYYDNGSGLQDSTRTVIRDADALRRIWENATSTQSSPPPAPEVDFSREMLVVVGAGRMTPDDQIRVDNVGLTREMNAAGRMTETLSVTVKTTVGCRRFNADAYPVEIVRLRRFEGPIKFVERREQAEGCVPDAAATDPA